MPKIRADQYEALRDALVAAFTLQEFKELAKTSFRVDLEEDLNLKSGTKTVFWDFMGWVERRGNLDDLFEAAFKRRPDNEKLQAFAAHIGRATVRSTERALSRSSFDLAAHELKCRRALDGQIDRGLRILLFAGDESQLFNSAAFNCLLERLRPVVYRTAGRAPEEKEIPLHPLVTNLESSLNRVKRLADTVSQRHVLVKVLATQARSNTLVAFVTAVRKEFAGPLAHDLVLFVHVAAANAASPWPAGLVDVCLDPPAFAAADLYEWVERVSDGKGWSEALKTDFKRALSDLAFVETQPDEGNFYDAIDDAIEKLRQAADEAALRALITRNRTVKAS